jgi:hypothetical protein
VIREGGELDIQRLYLLKNRTANQKACRSKKATGVELHDLFSENNLEQNSTKVVVLGCLSSIRVVLGCLSSKGVEDLLVIGGEQRQIMTQQNKDSLHWSIAFATVK